MKPLFPDTEELHLDFRLRDPAGRILSEDLQVHLLQLSKLAATAQNVSGASAIEQWAYFMINAGSLTLFEVQRLFADQEFTEAARILEMISKTPEQRLQYDARRKFQMDEAARMALAREEGLHEGIREGLHRGELLGRTRVFQELLAVELPTADELSNCDVAQLAELADQLQGQLRGASD